MYVTNLLTFRAHVVNGYSDVTVENVFLIGGSVIK